MDGVVWGDTERLGEALQKLDNHQSRPEVRAALEGDIGIVDRYSDTIQTDLRYLALPVYR